MLDHVKDLLAFSEQRCAACHAPFQAKADSVFCPSCMSLLMRQASFRCGICGKTVSAPGAACVRCIADAPWTRCLVVADYEGYLRECLLRAKFNDDFPLLHRFGRLLGRRMRETGIALHRPCLVPVPLHPVRLRHRGFNQCLEIASGMAAETGFDVLADAVSRIRDTPTQRTLTRDERQRNVKDAFKASEALRHRDVVIVDDVLTTGATLKAVAASVRHVTSGCLLIAVVAVDV